MHTITIANQKGGCGKTTVAINLSASLAREARRVLLVDLDPQAHCAVGLAVPEEQIDLSILECLLRQVEGEPLELSRITWQIAPNLELAPSRPQLATLEPKLGDRKGADTLLRDLLEENADRYDYCVVDCPPHMGLLMRNGLRAADEVIIPVDTGYFSLYGLTQQLATIEQLGERNGGKPWVRVLANQYDVRTKLAREILAELRKRFEHVVYDTTVNFNTKLKEGASFGQPITEFAPNSIGARDFQKLARELIAVEPSSIPTAEILEHVERLSADADRLLATTATLVRSGATTTSEPITIGSTAAMPSAQVPVARSKKPPEAAMSSARTRRLADVTSKTATHQKFHSSSPTTSVPLGPATTPLDESAEGGSNAEIDRKIEAVYGVRQEGDLVIFCSHNPHASEVQLAGEFNDWIPHTTPMRRLPNGDFEARMRLPKGRYRYRLVVDGRWSHDQNNPVVEANEYGELNSVVEIER